MANDKEVNEVETFCPKNRQQWRAWLQKNHHKKQSVWLVYYKKKADMPTITWSEAVDEALCFGWIDSKAKPIDEERFMHFFTRRKPKSVWSKINKAKVERMAAEGLMTKAGFETIEIAKENGMWSILDEVEELIIPKDLEKEFKKKAKARKYFLGLSRSDKRAMLLWLVMAKRPETRQARITEIVELAGQEMKPKHLQVRKKGA